ERSRIEAHLLLVADRPCEPHSIAEAEDVASVLDLKRAVGLGRRARQDAADWRAHARHRFDQEQLPLVWRDATWEEDVVAVFLVTEGLGPLGRGIQRLPVHVREILQAIDDLLRDRVHRARLGDEALVDRVDELADASSLRETHEIAVL